MTRSASAPWLAFFLLLAACPAPKVDEDSSDIEDTSEDSEDSGDSGDSGGEGDLPTCDTSFAACGGDPVGTWEAEAFCLEGSSEPVDGCPEATVEEEIIPEGTLDILADGTYTVSLSISYRSTVRYPLDCLPDGMSCEDADSEGNCAEEAGVCVCTSTEPGSPSEDSGTWDASGTTLTMDGDSTEFCATADSLGISDGEEAVLWFSR